mgnify:CR=1 FL=1
MRLGVFHHPNRIALFPPNTALLPAAPVVARIEVDVLALLDGAARRRHAAGAQFPNDFVQRLFRAAPPEPDVLERRVESLVHQRANNDIK